MKRILLSLLLAITPTLGLRPAEMPDAPPIDTNALLQELASLRQKVEQVSKQTRDNALRSILQAAASENASIEFYKDAIKAVQFEGRHNASAEFGEWRSKGRTEDKLKSKEFRAAVQFHLRYLSIALQHAADESEEAKVEPLMAYARDLQDKEEEVDMADPLMRQPVTRGVFVEWLDIAPLLPRGEGWELAPGNLDSIYEKSILPAMRKAKSPLLLQYWDFRIALEEKKVKDSNLTMAMDRFQRRTRPQYLWEKAEDKARLGLRNSAMRDMFDVIRSNLDHPRFAAWIARLEAVIKGEDTPAPPTSTPGQTPRALQ